MVLAIGRKKLSKPSRGENVDARAVRLVDELGGKPLDTARYNKAYLVVKRAFDILFSSSVLVACAPIMVVVCAAVKADDPSAPILFRQQRVGKNGKPFTMYKFRSMVANAEAMREDLSEQNYKDGPVFKILDDPRVTPVGRIIRKTSLDEVPNFVNVFLGQMSVVGPRPALPDEVAKYGPWEMQRLQVKPGVTCYWQAHPRRDDVSFDDWVALDLLYIREASVLVDLKIILKTVGVVLSLDGN